MKKHNPHDYTSKVLNNISSYLESLDTLLIVTQIKFHHYHVANVQIDESTSASEVTLKVCQKLYSKIVEVQNLVRDIQCGKLSKDTTHKGLKGKRMSFLWGIATVSFLAGGAYWTFKYVKV